jgi:hypothetical protein
MEFCTPSIILTVVLGTIFLVGLLKRNFYNAMITFFFGLFSVLIVTMACNRASEVAGWIALAAIVGFLILVQISKSSSLDVKALMNNKCVDEVCSGCGQGEAQDQCSPPPKIDPCAQPDC